MRLRPDARRTQDVLSNAVLDHLEELCQCHGEVITSMKVGLAVEHSVFSWLTPPSRTR
jgi:hypothetical protein